MFDAQALNLRLPRAFQAKRVRLITDDQRDVEIEVAARDVIDKRLQVAAGSGNQNGGTATPVCRELEEKWIRGTGCGDACIAEINALTVRESEEPRVRPDASAQQASGE